MTDLPVLVLTGGPAAGKTTTAREVARSIRQGAAIDVDDLRHLVVSGHAAPWDGEDGLLQQQLGVQNACLLACAFLGEGFAVVVADVVTPSTAQQYRAGLARVVVVRLAITVDEALRRSALRPEHLTPEEFRRLHEEQELDPPMADATVDVSSMTEQEQVAAVQALWLDAAT